MNKLLHDDYMKHVGEHLRHQAECHAQIRQVMLETTDSEKADLMREVLTKIGNAKATGNGRESFIWLLVASGINDCILREATATFEQIMTKLRSADRLSCGKPNPADQTYKMMDIVANVIAEPVPANWGSLVSMLLLAAERFGGVTIGEILKQMNDEAGVLLAAAKREKANEN